MVPTQGNLSASTHKAMPRPPQGQKWAQKSPGQISPTRARKPLSRKTNGTAHRVLLPLLFGEWIDLRMIATNPEIEPTAEDFFYHLYGCDCFHLFRMLRAIVIKASFYEVLLIFWHLF
jgi:hypothetical protein